MSYKQNLPILVVVLSAAAVVGFIALTRPPEEDLLREAVAAHVKTMDKVREFRVVGETVDVLRSDGAVTHLAFAKRDDAWRFDRDLSLDFAQRMQDPVSTREILERMARRVSQRFNSNVDVPSGLRYAYRVYRDAKGVTGEVAVVFDYPKSAEGKSMAGRYVETFVWSAGRWDSQGAGALFDSVAPR